MKLREGPEPIGRIADYVEVGLDDLWGPPHPLYIRKK